MLYFHRKFRKSMSMVLSHCCLFWTYISDSALEYKSVCMFILDAVVAFPRNLCSSSRSIAGVHHIWIFTPILDIWLRWGETRIALELVLWDSLWESKLPILIMVFRQRERVRISSRDADCLFFICLCLSLLVGASWLRSSCLTICQQHWGAQSGGKRINNKTRCHRNKHHAMKESVSWNSNN